MEIRDHHRRAIGNLIEAYRDDPDCLALIIGGSVAKGFARDDSDVDFMLVATDESYARRLAERDLFINRRDLTDYEGGYVDGKIIDRAFLHAVAAIAFDTGLASVGAGLTGLSVVALSLNKQFIDEDNAFTIDDYILVDALVSYELERWGARLHLRNLTDEEYQGRGFGNASVLPADGFNVLGGLTYHW